MLMFECDETLIQRNSCFNQLHSNKLLSTLCEHSLKEYKSPRSLLILGKKIS